MKKICVATGNRAEFDLLKGVIDRIDCAPDLELQMLVTGSHLSPEFGKTIDYVEDSGIKIDKRIEMLLSSDSRVGAAKSAGLGMIGFADAFCELNPDLVIILGDRYEMLAVAATATILGFPIAHLSGGDVTEGAIDDNIRHSITKLAHLHFPSNDLAYRRVLQMGEEKSRVHNVGSTFLDSVSNISLLGKEELEKDLGLSLSKNTLLITYHPVTRQPGASADQFQEITHALIDFSETQLVFTFPNCDPEGRKIIELIHGLKAKHPKRVFAFPSLGARRYFSLVKYVDGVIGNSSSGIAEIPSFKKGSINIGIRQNGRMTAESTINCEPTYSSVTQALQKLYSIEFMESLQHVQNPYGAGDASEKIVEIIRSCDYSNIMIKKFADASAR